VSAHSERPQARLCELEDDGLIAFEGEDAIAFLHAQVTSDLAGLASPATQYGGYCSPKGRLLATFLLWRRAADGPAVLLQLPGELRESIQSRLAKYVLRSRVKVTDASLRYARFGVSGPGAREAVTAVAGRAPDRVHEVVSSDGVDVTRLPVERYGVVCPTEQRDAVRARLLQFATGEAPAYWQRLDIEAGIPVITPATQDEYVPQMVNLDLVGGVSYSKGCYPGQEIVARTHYLGKLKQRMYRVTTPDVAVLAPGDRLYSGAFGADQASGAILYAAPAHGGSGDALAVIQTAAIRSGPLRLAAPDGPEVRLATLPYDVPA
jgi:folate-binding protein YgfZ